MQLLEPAWDHSLGTISFLALCHPNHQLLHSPDVLRTLKPRAYVFLSSTSRDSALALGSAGVALGSFWPTDHPYVYLPWDGVLVIKEQVHTLSINSGIQQFLL